MLKWRRKSRLGTLTSCSWEKMLDLLFTNSISLDHPCSDYDHLSKGCINLFYILLYSRVTKVNWEKKWGSFCSQSQDKDFNCSMIEVRGILCNWKVCLLKSNDSLELWSSKGNCTDWFFINSIGCLQLSSLYLHKFGYRKRYTIHPLYNLYTEIIEPGLWRWCIICLTCPMELPVSSSP